MGPGPRGAQGPRGPQSPQGTGVWGPRALGLSRGVWGAEPPRFQGGAGGRSTPPPLLMQPWAVYIGFS